jgi:predicted TIM-barrel fold metal-dependent hydrolase
MVAAESGRSQAITARDVAAQAAQYPDRLRAFCSFNPLKETENEFGQIASNVAPYLR